MKKKRRRFDAFENVEIRQLPRFGNRRQSLNLAAPFDEEYRNIGTTLAEFPRDSKEEIETLLHCRGNERQKTGRAFRRDDLRRVDQRREDARVEAESIAVSFSYVFRRNDDHVEVLEKLPIAIRKIMEHEDRLDPPSFRLHRRSRDGSLSPVTREDIWRKLVKLLLQQREKRLLRFDAPVRLASRFVQRDKDRRIDPGIVETIQFERQPHAADLYRRSASLRGRSQPAKRLDKFLFAGTNAVEERPAERPRLMTAPNELQKLFPRRDRRAAAYVKVVVTT